MNWKSVNFDWNRARAFLVTAEEGSFSAAAKALDLSQPTLGRQVNSLEQELGVALFDRVGKSLELTPSGLELIEHVRQMGEAANRLSLSASGQSQSIEGNVSISLSEVHSVYWLPSILVKLRKLAPGLTVEVVATNNVSDLRRRDADIAIRNFRPTQPELIAKKIKNISAQLYATPGYLASIGNPVTLEQFSKADFIGLDAGGMLLQGLNNHGFNLTKKNFPLFTESYLTHWALVKQGLGIGLMPDDIGDAQSTVQRIMPNLEPFDSPVWLTTHRELRTSRRVRLVFDLIAQELQDTD